MIRSQRSRDIIFRGWRWGNREIESLHDRLKGRIVFDGVSPADKSKVIQSIVCREEPA